MQKNLKAIALILAAKFFTTIIIAYFLPHNLNNTLRFDEGQGIVVLIAMTGNIDGVATGRSEMFEFAPESDEFIAINNLLSGYTYNRAIFRDTGQFSTGRLQRRGSGDGRVWTSITIFGNNSSLAIVNMPGINARVNGNMRRIPQRRIIELINGIMQICGMP